MKKLLLILTISFSFMGLLFILPSYAFDEFYWVGDSGYWDDPNNWSLTQDGEGGAGLPSYSPTYVISDDEIDWVIDINGYNQPSGNELLIDAYSTGTITFEIQEGRLGGNRHTSIGSNSQPMSIIVNQSGGLVGSADMFSNVANTMYNISGGCLGCGESLVIMDSIVNQSGGEVWTGWAMRIENTTYNISDGLLRSGNLHLIDSTMNQTGGEVYITGEGGRLSGGIYNLSGGRLNLIHPGWGISAIFNMSGGTLNSQVTRNEGTFNYTGGNITLNWFENLGTVTLGGDDTSVVDGEIVKTLNNGTWKTSHTTVEYTGSFTNNGAYISDPSTQYFEDLIVGETGYLVGQHSDYFYLSGDFINSSIMNYDWNTKQAYLGFIEGEDNLHNFYLTGEDLGQTMSGVADNFSWGTLDITANSLTLFDGNDEFGAALYLRNLVGAEILGDTILNIFGGDGFTIYYNKHLQENSYLAGLDYKLSGGGYLRAVVPEPATMFLFGTGITGLVGFRMRRRKK